MSFNEQGRQFRTLDKSVREQEVAVRQPPKLQYTQMPVIHPNVIKYLGNLPQFVPSYHTEEPQCQPIKWKDSTYIGQIKNGIPEGLGVMIKPNGTYMHGSFKGGISNGKFRIVSPSPFIFQGNILNDMPQGEGSYKSQSNHFRGKFAIGLPTGEGEETYRDGEWIFKGTYQMGVKRQGLLKWGKNAEGHYTNYYQGPLDKEGKYDGIGTLKTPDGIYKGEFKNCMKQGKGEFVYQNGCRYSGTYKRNLKYGKGTYFNGNKSKWYQGDWHRDLPHGRGQFFTNNVSSGVIDVVYGIKKDELPMQTS